MRFSLDRGMVAPTIVIGVGVFFWIRSYGLPEPRLEPLGPSFFPRLLIASLIVLALLDLVTQIRRSRRSGQTVVPEKRSPKPIGNRKRLFASVLIVGVFLGIIYVRVVPFFLTTPLFLFLLMYSLYPKPVRGKDVVTMIVVNVAVMGLIYVLFVRMLWVAFD